MHIVPTSLAVLCASACFGAVGICSITCRCEPDFLRRSDGMGERKEKHDAVG